MASGYDINPDAFQQYDRDTAQLLVNLYPWFYLPSAVHKVLIHGGDIIRASLLPIGKNKELTVIVID